MNSTEWEVVKNLALQILEEIDAMVLEDLLEHVEQQNTENYDRAMEIFSE